MWYVGLSLLNPSKEVSLICFKLVNASSLAESITATRQGDNIRLLTYISIVSLFTHQLSGANKTSDLSPSDSGDGVLRGLIYKFTH